MADEQVQHLGIRFSALTALMHRPQILTGWIRDILLRHFQEGQIEHPELARLIWHDTERANILIENHTNWTPDISGRRPAIILKRNAFENVRLGIADRHTGVGLDGKDMFTTFWTGSHTCFCIGETGAQAEVLATEVQREFTRYADVFREELGMHRFRVISVGEVSQLEEATENFVVPVTAGYSFEESWIAGPDAPILHKISLSLSSLL